MRESDKTNDSLEENENKCVGVTMPLLTDSKGEKFGKSMGNAIWLDPFKTSVYDFYQFFRKTSDTQIETLLYYYTFLSPLEIDDVLKIHEQSPALHAPQRKLAFEITALVHGIQKATECQDISEFLFDDKPLEDSHSRVVDAFRTNLKSKFVILPKEKVLGKDAIEAAALSGLTKSISQAKKIRKQGGFYINKKRVAQDYILDSKDLIHDCIILLRTGKENYLLLHLN
jgi:tyrosyl-tRNA synthetase